MKESAKDRLHKVLVIGANPAGLAAANKLGEMGVPVTLVDPDPDLNAKLARDVWRLPSGLPLNFAHRPGLLRILRNPQIRCLLPAQVTSIKHSSQGFSARLLVQPTYVNEDRCTLCGRCLETCPVTDADGNKPVHLDSRYMLPGRAVIDKRRRPLCQEACPLNVNVQGYLALTRAGLYAEALELIRRDNVLPAICGRVCTHPCEAACRRSDLDGAVAIKDIKRFLADEAPSVSTAHTAPRRPEKIAVIGSGPAGLAAAADLARWGYTVTIFEKEAQLGGLLRYGIGPHRLPRDVLDREIQWIQSLGVRMITSHAVDLSRLDTLSQDYDAVIVAVGTWKDRSLGVPGEDLDGVHGCVEFLSSVHRGEVSHLPEDVVVIGDGNAAFDLARVLVRLKARVTLLSWFPKDLIPADPEEVKEARLEGVRVIDRTRVTAFLGENGRLTHLRCVETIPGPPDAKGIPWPVTKPGAQPFLRPCRRAFVAIGQQPDATVFGVPAPALAVNAQGLLIVDTQGGTSRAGIYAAGDVVSGPSSVVQAMASGRRAALAVHRTLSCEDVKPVSIRPENRELRPIPENLVFRGRPASAHVDPSRRTCDFSEVCLGLSEVQVHSEAERCLQCGVCAECLQCLEVCNGCGAVNHGQVVQEVVEQAGVVILADPNLAPSIRGEDVLRAYSPKGFGREDVYAMMLRGFAAAGEAMVLLGENAQRMKGHGLSFVPPDPPLASQVRIGVFVCRCNDSLGWSEAMTDYVTSLRDRPDIVHAEVLPSACNPEKTRYLVQTIREKGLTRVVLASCVCCPLDFVCSACTDQRSRLKSALFNATGISRAMVETCNLRGEALRFLAQGQDIAFERFKGLLERSIGRTRKLKPMPAPARPYNFTTAVIGSSSAALKSALTLTQCGMDVLLFTGTQEEADEEAMPNHPNVQVFRNADIRGLKGTVGSFHIMAFIDGVPQVFHAGAVILGERSRRRIPYVPYENLPPRPVEWTMQRRGVPGVPFFYPGATSVPGLFLANPPGIPISQRIKGAAAAVLAAAVMPRRPRHSKGYTVTIDASRCRGCGRCAEVCPHHAVSIYQNEWGYGTASVDEALCKGCGNCIAMCPSNAADSPYRDRTVLEQMIQEILA
ncbi:MAG: FAD-dependent oxidoreductase [Desulfosoma sp.]